MNDILICILIGVLFVIGLMCITSSNKNSGQPPSTVSKSSQANSNDDIEFVNHNRKEEDAYDLLGNIDVEEAGDLSFGMGPGLYGSGRHNFDMMIL